MDTYGCLFEGSVDGSNGKSDVLVCDDDSGSGGQFRMLSQLNGGQSYTVSLTTDQERVTGHYTLIVTGPASVSMSARIPVSPSISTSTMGPTNSTDALSSYSDVLANDSPVYFRPSANNASDYFFQAFTLTVYQTGLYSVSSSSAIDTYGYLYQWNFSPFQPALNLVNQDDDSAGNGQFQMTHWLQAGVSYVLVATTFAPGVTGSITVSTLGPNYVGLTSLYFPPASNSSKLRLRTIDLI